jgi:iron complex outermembrane recepter protein
LDAGSARLRLQGRLLMSRLSKNRYLSSSALLLLMVGAMAGRSEAEESGNPIVLDTITISGEKGNGPVQGYVARRSTAGTKTDTPLNKTPQSIAVVGQEQMKDLNVQSVAEALRFTPGVNTEYRGASNLQDEIGVRGFYYVPKYLDGLLFDNGNSGSYSKIYPYLLERVELISGPSSVLFGQANPGGLINMVSKKPTGEPIREIEFTGGSRNYYGASFDFSDKVPGSDTLSYRIVGTGLTTDLQEDFTRQEGFAIAPSLTWTPDDQTSLTILGGYQREPHAGFRNFLDAVGTVEPIPGYGRIPRSFMVSDPDFEKFERDQAWIGYEFERELNDTFTVRQNARYQHVEYEHNTLVFGSKKPDPVTGNETLISRIASGGGARTSQFTIDNQVEAKFSTGQAEHTLLGGLDYRYYSRDYHWARGSVPDIDLTDPQYGNIDFSSIVLSPSQVDETTARQTGIYIQDQIEIGKLNLMAGGRYDWASTDIDDKLGTNDQSYDDNAFTWRAGAIYNFDNGLSPYVSYSTSFEPSLTAPGKNQDAFDPTTAEQYEIGVKYTPVGTDIVLTAAYFDLSQKDVVKGQWINGENVYRQIGKIHNRGVEISAKAQIHDRLTLIGSYAYLDSEVKNSVNELEIGKTPARQPAHQAALWAKYDFDSGALNGLSIGGGVRYQGRSWGDDTNTFEVGSATLFDAMISYDFEAANPDWSGLKLQVNAKNLANKEYVSSCSNAYACFYGEGRTVTATLKKSW